ncbi:hypothetical protein ABK178_004808 [Salmonella enterica subsp. enterica serovar Brandenburg]|nr:hypothetical protein [Salmonella enterica subsp. enterica serovar Montevideo]ECA5180234.1 hypothetical protein [Salmonella enterica subsp. enterica serovar Newport]ECD3767251.1 hypothetical protein [Salmonella enterica subsp. enterica serovar Onderstepoort]EDA8241164.1 hypothetical protein [Salmonella enterica subsp. enterica serovar Reading]EDS4117737.1 hypothetical protein [Salmonella enterica subsp. enterica serovar Braenderup]EDT6459502.1 hypothetical protein [Salmonella enterica subsp.
MSENQNIRNTYIKKYAGFFTEDSIENLNDVINFITVISEFSRKDTFVQANEMESLANILYRELQTIKSGMHLSGGIFSWRKAEAAGIARKQEVTSN